MMKRSLQRTLQRITVLHRHLHTIPCAFSTQPTPSISVTPALGLVDEKVTIRLSGLESNQIVTLVANIKENGNTFESRGVYKANNIGNIDSTTDSSLAGTYTGAHPMGLFWSLQPAPDPKKVIRLVKKDVSTPMNYHINVYNRAHEDGHDLPQKPITTALAQRLYKRPGVRRVPVTEGKYKETVFIPEGLSQMIKKS